MFSTGGYSTALAVDKAALQLSHETARLKTLTFRGQLTTNSRTVPPNATTAGPLDQEGTSFEWRACVNRETLPQRSAHPEDPEETIEWPAPRPLPYATGMIRKVAKHYRQGTLLSVIVKKGRTIVCTPRWWARRMTRCDGPGSWIFATSKAAEMFSLRMAFLFPWPFRLFLAYGALTRAILGFVPFGPQLFRKATALTTRRHGLECVSVPTIAGEVTLQLHDPRMLVVPGEIREFSADPFLQLISADGCLLDIGANYGSFSMAAVRLKGQTLRVEAFEPNPELGFLLKRNLEACHSADWRVHERLAGRQSGVVKSLAVPLHSSGEGRAIMEGMVHSHNSHCRCYQVATLALDDLLPLEAGDVFMKVDVEGHELEVLQGASQLLQLHRPLIYMEVNHRATAAAGHSLADVAGFLEPLGYSCYLVNDNPIPRWVECLQWEEHRDVLLVHCDHLSARPWLRRVGRGPAKAAERKSSQEKGRDAEWHCRTSP